MSKFVNSSISISAPILEERLKRLEQQFNFLNQTLSGYFTIGRLRIDRSAPASSSDVQPLDALYDIVRTPTYTYVAIDNAGTLEWRRITMNSF